jgi:hypothetical protein
VLLCQHVAVLLLLPAIPDSGRQLIGYRLGGRVCGRCGHEPSALPRVLVGSCSWANRPPQSALRAGLMASSEEKNAAAASRARAAIPKYRKET